MPGFAIVSADDVDDADAGSDVPGEFRRLTDALGAEQVAVTLIRVPPHSDMEQGTGHPLGDRGTPHRRQGSITMRREEHVEAVAALAVVREASPEAKQTR